MRRWGIILTMGLVLVLGVAPLGAVSNASSLPAVGGEPEGGIGYDEGGELDLEVGIGGTEGETKPVDHPGKGGGEDRSCQFGDHEIDCESQFGMWNGTCYVELADPQPPKDDAAWDGHEDGVIVVCMPYVCVPQPGQDTIPVADCPGRSLYWAARAPGVEVDPAVLAQRAVDRMQLRGIDVGIVPEDKPGSVGIVGMPQWMWVNEPTPNTFGPIEASASAGGYTVSASASVDKIVWDMGDGSSVTCTTAGTPYADQYGKSDSPDCGHRYTKQGEYRVTATSYWTVAWEGIGQTGTIPMEMVSTANIVMGEAQVITQ